MFFPLPTFLFFHHSHISFPLIFVLPTFLFFHHSHISFSLYLTTQPDSLKNILQKPHKFFPFPLSSLSPPSSNSLFTIIEPQHHNKYKTQHLSLLLPIHFHLKKPNTNITYDLSSSLFLQHNINIKTQHNHTTM